MWWSECGVGGQRTHEVSLRWNQVFAFFSHFCIVIDCQPHTHTYTLSHIHTDDYSSLSFPSSRSYDHEPEGRITLPALSLSLHPPRHPIFARSRIRGHVKHRPSGRPCPFRPYAMGYAVKFNDLGRAYAVAADTIPSQHSALAAQCSRRYWSGRHLFHASICCISVLGCWKALALHRRTV